MVRLSVILVFAVLLLFGGTAHAIDKKKVKGKDVPVSQTDKKTEDRDTGAVLPDTRRKDPGHGKYDDFVDKNGNGIDDRVERAQQKPEKSKMPNKESSEKSGKIGPGDTLKTKKTKN